MKTRPFAEAIEAAHNGEKSRCLCPGHPDRDPSLDVSPGDKGGVVIICRSAGCTAKHIMESTGLTLKHLAPRNGHSHSKPEQKPRWIPYEIVPDDAPPYDTTHPKLGKPDHEYIYRNSAGSIICIVCRWDIPEKKQIRQFTYCRHSQTGRKQWQWEGPESKPLYGLDILAARPGDPVLVVEGEKTAHAARTLLPNHVVLTWLGGAESAAKANWKPLVGRNVAIWPDNDESGFKAAESILTRVPDSRIVKLPDGLPPKWDLADALADGWTTERVLPCLIPQPEPVKPKPAGELYYESGRGVWWTRNSRRSYTQIDKDSAKKILALAGHSLAKSEQGMSDADREMIRLQLEEDVIYAGPVAGYPVGRHDTGGSRILVTEPVTILPAVQGPHTRILHYLSSMLCDDGEQLYRLILWLKLRREAIRTNTHRAGHALVLVGPADCGKSVTQNLIVTPLLGGRIAKPWRYMSQETTFNEDLIASEHLCIEDDSAARDLHTRRTVGSNIKSMLFSRVQSCHGKNRKAISLVPIWAMSFSLNNEPENLQVLPPIDESLKDKLLVFKCQRPVLPVKTDNDRRDYTAEILSELPGLAYFIDTFEVPEHWKSPRCGFTAFQHPDVLSDIGDLSPEASLLDIIDSTLFTTDLESSWRGKASDLETRLRDGPRSSEISRLFSFRTACGVYLARLKEQFPDRFERVRTRNHNEWRILPPKPEPVEGYAGSVEG